MRSSGLALLPLLLTACPPAPEACTIKVKSVYPADNADDAYYRADIDFELSNPDPSAVITTDIPGEPGQSSDGKHILWHPSAPLTPGTDYEACIETCAERVCTSFTTSDAGLPLTDRNALVDTTFLFDLHAGRVPVPAGLGDVLIENLGANILLGIQTIGTGTMDVIGAVSQLGETTQDYCSPTIAFAGADFTDEPYVSFTNPQFLLIASGEEVPVFGAVLSGTFLPDGSALAGMTFAGMIDTRPLAPLLDDGDGSENAICELALNFNTSCVACPDGSGTFCLEIEADHIDAPVMPGVLVVPICEANAPECATTAPTDTCL